MVWTLGISGLYHDAAAAIVKNGEVIAAAQEERFTRIKNDPSFPISAINYCLEEAAIDAEQLDAAVFYEKPLRTFNRLVESFQSAGLNGLQGWERAFTRWASTKLHIDSIITESVPIRRDRVLYVPHHMAHAAAAYYPSPFDQAAVLTVDGVGEWTTASIAVGRGKDLELIREMSFPHSLGLLYSAFTYFVGFKVNSGEYKMMGLAPYGKPKYLDLILEKLAKIKDDGSIELNLNYFGHLAGQSMISPKFEALFDGPPRDPESPITRREMDISASVQAFCELAVLKMAEYAFRVTKLPHLCLAGGVALNCVANGKLLRSNVFERLWIQPAAGDAGSALGSALLVQHGYFGVPRTDSKGQCRQKGSYLGPSFSRAEVKAFLQSYDISHTELAPNRAPAVIAEALERGQVVGLFHGRMEFGPRALGCRSILGNPIRPETQSRMNRQIKYRESFRPFAPAVRIEDVAEYFEIDVPSPFMQLVAQVRPERRVNRESDDIDGDDLVSAVNQVRSDIPAVTHWDYSARVQTVHKETNPFFHDIITEFKERTGIGVLVNTSFNVRGEPIVCTPADALRCFSNTDMDLLYLEGFWIDKAAQVPLQGEEMARWRSNFSPD